jgi:predicted adenylyl cyclase CyaB
MPGITKNIEIKAKISDWQKLYQLVVALSDAQEEILIQKDIFFPAQNGRLKLRIFRDDYGELIHYQRENTLEAKESNYVIAKTTEPLAMQTALSKALGVVGIVEKKRLLYKTGQTRIHLDQVAGLGNFLELEYVLSPREDIDIAKSLVADLMRYLEITSNDLIANAYIDMLL